jgi:FkbM family methyltransferase
LNVFIDPRFDDDYRRHPIVLVDVGARGGLRSNWIPARRHLRLIGFEPDKKEHALLAAQSAAGENATRFFDVALHNRREPIRFNIARDRGLSSIFEPDRAFLDAFPDSARFDTIDVQQVDADRLDNLLQAGAVDDIDFVKADTQGSELFVLQGASRALTDSAVGVEVEVEFAPIYKGQPVFADVDAFMRGLGYQLFDLRPVYWKRAAGRDLGGPRGQIIWGDALYLKGLPALLAMVGGLDAAGRKSKLLKAISVALLYGYHDYALEIAGSAGYLFSADDLKVVRARLREGGTPRVVLPRFPGKRALAAAFHRLWRIFLPRDDDAWSVSDPKLGN